MMGLSHKEHIDHKESWALPKIPKPFVDFVIFVAKTKSRQ